MNACESVSDRMPDVLHHRASWSEAERDHLTHCAECALEWRVVAAGAVLQQGLVVDSAAISGQLLARVRDEHGGTPIRRLPWRGTRIGLGLLAAAASIAILIRVPATRRVGAPPAVRITPVAVLPELERLTETQLEAVLLELDVPDVTVSPMRLPRLGDLTDSQLEQVLLSLEG